MAFPPINHLFEGTPMETSMLWKLWNLWEKLQVQTSNLVLQTFQSQRLVIWVWAQYRWTLSTELDGEYSRWTQPRVLSFDPSTPIPMFEEHGITVRSAPPWLLRCCLTFYRRREKPEKTGLRADIFEQVPKLVCHATPRKKWGDTGDISVYGSG